MDLSPQQLRKVEFRERWRGYDPDEVDDYLERVAAVFELMQERLRAATERAAEAEARAGSSDVSDDALRRTLVLAQRTADLVEQEAREQAARIVAEAEDRARVVAEEAEATTRRMIAEGEATLRSDVAALEAVRVELQYDVEALERWVEQARAAVRRALQDELARVEGLAPRLGPRPKIHDVEVPPAPFASESDGDGDPGDRHDEAATPGDGGPPTEAWQPAGDDADTADDGGGEAPEGAATADDDIDYFADLREAMADETPLGPRDDDELPAPDESRPADQAHDAGSSRSVLGGDGD